ncbi:MAG: lipoyl(octanoyl) transferase LipB [Parvibaculaceae bacterium]
MVKTSPLSPAPSQESDVVEWRISDSPVPYSEALAEMESRVRSISDHFHREIVWLLEHPALYTAGTSADEKDLLSPDRFPVFKTGRGGQYTYHGPGQRVGYVMLDLKKRGQDVRKFVGDLEQWLIATLAEFGVTGELREGRVGVWVRRPDKGVGREDKIAAIGVRIRKWVTFHGVSLNVDPDLSHFDGIVPCGISQHGVTSLADLGITATMEDVDVAMKKTFAKVFG